jgi:hypothetical protein
MPPRFQMPTDEEMMTVLRPILVDRNVLRIPHRDPREPCQKALREHWPDMPLKKARAAVLRLRLGSPSRVPR